MPMGCSRSTHAGCGWILTAALLLAAVLLWWEPDAVGGALLVTPLNKLVGSPDLELDLFPSLFFLGCHGGGGKEKGWRGSSFGRAILVRPWSFSSTAPVWKLWSSELPVVFNVVLLHLEVEGRPPRVQRIFSAGSVNSSRPPCRKGGSHSTLTWQFQSLLPVCHRQCCSHSSAPSGLVPGGGGIGPELKLATRTRLLFSFVCWGPVCKVFGLGCNFTFLMGPFVICTCMLI